MRKINSKNSLSNAWESKFKITIFIAISLSLVGFVACKNPNSSSSGGGSNSTNNSATYITPNRLELSFEGNKWEINYLNMGSFFLKGTFTKNENEYIFECTELGKSVKIESSDLPFKFAGITMENDNILVPITSGTPMPSAVTPFNYLIFTKSSCNAENSGEKLKDFVGQWFDGFNFLTIGKYYGSYGEYCVAFSGGIGGIPYKECRIFGNKIYYSDSLNIYILELSDDKKNMSKTVHYYKINNDDNFSVELKRTDEFELKDGVLTAQGVYKILKEKGLVEDIDFDSVIHGNTDNVIAAEAELSIGGTIYYKTTATAFEIPAEYFSIYKAFGGGYMHGSTIETITFAPGSKIERIGAESFKNSSLTEITIPASVKSIGTEAFDGCNKLKSITFEDTNGWQLYDRNGKAEPIDVTDPEKNAKNLSSRFEWGGLDRYLKKE